MSRKSVRLVVITLILLLGMQINVFAAEKISQTSSSLLEYSQSDLNLLAHLIESEACGEPYAGKIAVGNVVVNRARMDDKSISSVIYQPNQFSGVKTSRFKSTPSKDSIKAAKEVLEGKNIVPDAYFFVNLNKCRATFVKKKKFITRIGDHWFYAKW
ncbi:MAG: cell wall hydrolase [Clostridiaceae bacterium]